MDETRLNQFKSAALQAGYDSSEIDGFVKMIPEKKQEIQQATNYEPNVSSQEGNVGTFQQEKYVPKSSFDSVIPTNSRMSQAYGIRNPIEKYSGGVHMGTDWSTPEGTQVNTPPGNWIVREAYGTARQGQRSANNGYGNSVVLINQNTGETIRMSHLAQVNVKPGQMITTGTPLAFTGSTGNSTGPHLDVEYRTPSGKTASILSTMYGQYF